MPDEDFNQNYERRREVIDSLADRLYERARAINGDISLPSSAEKDRAQQAWVLNELENLKFVINDYKDKLRSS
jgi:hypothetical protein